MQHTTDCQASSHKALRDTVTPGRLFKCKPKSTPEPRRPQQAGRWLSPPCASMAYSCKATWNRDKRQGETLPFILFRDCKIRNLVKSSPPFLKYQQDHYCYQNHLYESLPYLNNFVHLQIFQGRIERHVDAASLGWRKTKKRLAIRYLPSITA